MGAPVSRAKALTVPAVELQTGWRGRALPVSLCQDHNVLAEVTQCDFDLSNPGFCAYAEARGVLYKAGYRTDDEGRITRRWQATADHAFTREQFMADPYFQYAGEYMGHRYSYTPDEMDALWRVLRIVKGALQDCWQLYLAQAVAEQGTEPACKRLELAEEIALVDHADRLSFTLALGSSHDLGAVVAHQPVAAAGIADQQIAGLTGHAIPADAAEVMDDRLDSTSLSADERASDHKDTALELDHRDRVIAQQLTAGVRSVRGEPAADVRSDKTEQFAFFFAGDRSVGEGCHKSLVEHVKRPLGNVVLVRLKPANHEGRFACIDLAVSDDALEQARQLMRSLAGNAPEVDRWAKRLAVRVPEGVSRGHSNHRRARAKLLHVASAQQCDQSAVCRAEPFGSTRHPVVQITNERQCSIGFRRSNAGASSAFDYPDREGRPLPSFTVGNHVAVKQRAGIKAVAADKVRMRPMNRPGVSGQPWRFEFHPIPPASHSPSSEFIAQNDREGL